MEEKKTLKIGDYYWVALSPYKIFPVQYNADRQDDQWIASEVAYSTKQDAREAMGLGNPIPEEAPVQTMVKEIDWEQRRYEIARDALVGLHSNPEDLCTPKEFDGNIYAWSVAIADNLIEELKKQQEMNQLFEVKVSYERQADELEARKVSEVYLINALSFTEAEARATKEIQSYAFGGELTIDSCRKRRIAEIIESADHRDDKWFEARVSFITLDEKSGTERKIPVTMLIQSDTLPNALGRLQEELSKQLGNYEINVIKETSILEYYKYETQN